MVFRKSAQPAPTGPVEIFEKAPACEPIAPNNFQFPKDFRELRSENFAENFQTADLNRDGHMDVVIANGYSANENSVSVFLGNGDGTLQSSVSSRAPDWPTNVAVGDYDGDGLLDLAILGRMSDSHPDGVLAILHGQGDGSFRYIGKYVLNAYSTDIITTDFNGDCNLDLAVAVRGRDNISILMGNGDGTFQSAVEYATDHFPNGHAVGDLNGDGYLDLVTNANLKISTLLGNGDGTFQPYQTVRVDGGLGGVVVADFNQDGRLDMTTPYGNGTGSILLQNSTGDFSPQR